MKATIDSETKARVCDRLLTVEAEITQLEDTTPHDQLPARYDDLIKQRDAAQALLRD